MIINCVFSINLIYRSNNNKTYVYIFMQSDVFKLWDQKLVILAFLEKIAHWKWVKK